MRESGSWQGFLLIAALQLIQVVGIVIPCTPIQLAAGAVFGALPGALACETGYLMGNLLVFLVARKAGSFCPIDRPNSRLQLLLDATHPGMMIFLCCMIPIIPNGLIPYVAARTSITVGSYAIAVLAGSLLGIVSWCTIGSSLLHGDWLSAGILVVLLGILIFLLYRRRDALIRWINDHRQM